jgi:hypothetical protein
MERERERERERKRERSKISKIGMVCFSLWPQSNGRQGKAGKAIKRSDKIPTHPEIFFLKCSQ